MVEAASWVPDTFRNTCLKISNDKIVFLKVISNVIKSGMDIVGVDTPQKM